VRRRKMECFTPAPQNTLRQSIKQKSSGGAGYRNLWEKVDSSLKVDWFQIWCCCISRRFLRLFSCGRICKETPLEKSARSLILQELFWSARPTEARGGMIRAGNGRWLPSNPATMSPGESKARHHLILQIESGSPAIRLLNLIQTVYPDGRPVGTGSKAPRIQVLRPAYPTPAALRKAQEEVAEFHRFRELSQNLLDVNEKICKQRPVGDAFMPQEKKRRKRSIRKSNGK
jgi:hypothetical protein